MYDSVSAAVLHVIKNAGFNVRESKVVRRPRGELLARVDATNTITGERWTVHAETERDAVIEIARQVGIELED